MTPVIFDGQKENIGKILSVRITKTNRTTLFGEIVNKSNKKVA
jgi:tRNA-2-methylthio-N6-dimethylallyladenosine synthase